ncbi:dual specificity protein phosphatase family protein [Halomicroarcula sp. GCM10025709]|uniref:protein-tyrosine phosphatase family protein n=1 Tax=Haloarcula TaxID=2237 RepID=UPI0024C3AF9D|nr:dual specificity protein phosphatase [Halomicroarcula sp. YJ-61-S]
MSKSCTTAPNGELPPWTGLQLSCSSGTTEDASDETLLQEHNIATVVSLTHGEPRSGFLSDVTVESVPMMDGPQNDPETFAEAVRIVLTHLDAGDRVLVHCSAGASCSPAVAATAITCRSEKTLDDSFTQVLERRPEADPHDALARHAVAVTEE